MVAAADGGVGVGAADQGLLAARGQAQGEGGGDGQGVAAVANGFELRAANRALGSHLLDFVAEGDQVQGLAEGPHESVAVEARANHVLVVAGDPFFDFLFQVGVELALVDAQAVEESEVLLGYFAQARDRNRRDSFRQVGEAFLVGGDDARPAGHVVSLIGGVVHVEGPAVGAGEHFQVAEQAAGLLGEHRPDVQFQVALGQRGRRAANSGFLSLLTNSC